MRWEAVIERFAPSSLVDDSLFEGTPEKDLSLKGDIEIRGVTVLNAEGQPVLEDINLSILKVLVLLSKQAMKPQRWHSRIY